MVAGGSGLVGGAVVDRLLDDGARVVLPSRSPGGPLARAGHPGLRCVHVGDWATPSGLLAVLAEPGWAPTAAVAAVGGWWRGPDLVDLDVVTWRSLVESHLTGHYLAVRALAPLLTGQDPAYVMLGGAAATEPMAGSGPVSITGAAQRMLLEVLRAERIGQRVRLHEVQVAVSVAGDDRNVAPAATVEAAQVAGAVASVLADPSSPAVVRVGGQG